MKTVFAALILSLIASICAAETRVALVIGNSAYENAAALPNPQRDASAIAKRLEGLGFEVTLGTDLDYRDFSKMLGRFARKASSADLSLVYYAGHGIELSGENFMIPVDATLEHEAEAEYETVSLQKIKDSAAQAKLLSIVLVDACRDNPWVSSIERIGATRSLSRGLAPLADAERGELISFATQAGRTALDGDGSHSPYAESLLELLDEPGVEVGHFFRRLRGAVSRKTDGQQSPIVRSSLPERLIYLVPPLPEEPATPKKEDTSVATVITPQQEGSEFFQSSFKSTLTEVTACDRAAGYRWHPRVEGGWVGYDALDPDAALATCQSALLEHPDEWFFYFLAGRAIWKKDENDPRIRRYMELGGRADPAFAYDRLGQLARRGFGGFDVDTDQAAEYYTKALEAGYQGALASLGDLYAYADPPDFNKAKDYYQQAIDAGIEFAANDFANLHSNNILPDANDAEALKYYELGCKTGDATACGNIGWLIVNDRVANPNKANGRKLLQDACAVEEGFACRALAHEHLDKSFDGANDSDALRLFAKGCDLSDANACGNVGWMHAENRVPAPDMDFAAMRLAFACDEDQAWACNYLGYMHVNAYQTGYNDTDAIALFEKGCDLGHNTACGNIGWMHKDRRVPNPDMAFALERFLETCENGSDYACGQVGEMYEDGIVGAPDFQLAAKFFSESCDMGRSWSCSRLADLYEDGDLGEVDFANAKLNFEKGCDGGNAWGCSRLADLYEDGDIGEVDFASALLYFGKGCDGGNAWGCARLGSLHEDADGTPRDFKKAFALYTKGCDGGDAWGCGRLGRLHYRGNGTAQNTAKAYPLMVTACNDDNGYYCEFASEIFELGEGGTQAEALAMRTRACGLQFGESCAVLGAGTIYPASDVEGESGDLLLKSLRFGSRWAINNTKKINRAALRSLQTALKAEGLYSGGVDGLTGPGTRRAMESAYDG